ncbi:unnamed protein product [Ranitomeya imitator]|uniref:Reverse transcriptase domain-containing protein n=1 Tax=Ranitomeya imitator TaxID=111125 RepID=A0ABN9LYJ9_9NEOB|nr:unnamed protein product [Ranitomeya imitator]
MERYFRQHGLMAPTPKSTKTRILQLRERLFYGFRQTAFFSQRSQGRTTNRRPTRRARRKNGHPLTGETPDLVINISDYLLSPAELTVLQKGLSFCPTPAWDSFQLEKDLERFFRTVRLKTHFGLASNTMGEVVHGSGNTMIPELSISSLGLRTPSKFSPPHTYHATETFISLVDREVKQFSHQQQLGFYPVHSNLSLVEKQALKSLQNNKTIIIKPADKGGAIVVMNYTDYTKEVIRQLSDPNTYDVIHRDPVTNITTKIRSLLKHYLDRHIIDQKTVSFLVNPHPITPVFYILPKIHKSLQNPPGRPIVASTDSVLSPLSVFLERILTPLVKKTKSYLLDTGHFLEIIQRQGTVPPESILVTLDVNSLYTSITHEKGIEATRYLLESSDMSIDSTQFCLDLLDIVLRENYFLYEDTFYVQKCGTAMGANVAPAYANAYMNLFEIQHVFPNDLFSRFALGYHRYIDDIFFIWTGTSNSMLDFISQLNSIYPELQFTLHHSTESVPFLDTLVIKDTRGGLSTDLYCKPTDSNSLLHYSSCHPRTTRDSLPRSQFNRVSRIVSNPEVRKERLDTVAQKFKLRHYPPRLLDNEKARILAPPSPPPPMYPRERVPFVHTFHPSMPKVYSIIKRHWPLLSRAYPNIDSFKAPALICTKRPSNIRDKLVRADVGSSRPTTTQQVLATRRQDPLNYCHLSDTMSKALVEPKRLYLSLPDFVSLFCSPI